MKKLFLPVLIILVFGSIVISQDLQLPRVSQKASVTQTVGLTDITITYSRPGVKGRTIWGELVPYDKVWRTGANEATTISFGDDVKIEGKPLPAGTYSLHTIPGKDSWTIIFNKVAKQWGSYSYDQAQDALRIQVKPEQGTEQEWMSFSFPDVGVHSATIQLAWEKLRVPFHVETNTAEKAMANIHKALSGQIKDWELPYDAASYVFNSNMENKDEAMKWLDQSIALKETYWNLRLKAEMLHKNGKNAEAIRTAERAVKLGKENKDEPSEVQKTEEQLAKWKAGGQGM